MLNIRTIRNQLGLSQREFANRLGVKRLAVARWESGTRTPDESNQKRLLQIAKENGLDTKSKIVSSNDENVSSKVDTLDTRSKIVSKELDTKSESGYNLDTKNVSNENELDTLDTKFVSNDQETGYNLDTKLDTNSKEDVTGDPVQAYYETMYKDTKGVISLCTITQPRDSDQKPSLQARGFYEISQISDLLAEVDKLNGTYHVYTGIHPLRERPSEGRGKEQDILGITLFAPDVDAKDFIDNPVEKQKANEERAFYRWTDELLSECKAKALTHINSVCERVSLPPTAIIDSGHGYYPIFKLERFVEFESNQHREELKKLNKTLHEVFSADNTFDFARILRVPGTRNIKPGYPADCKLVEFHPDRRYILDDIRRFEKLIELPLEKQSKPKPQAVSLDDETLISKAKNAKDGAKFTALWEGDISGYENNHSNADLALCCLLAFWTGGDRDRIDKLFRQSGLNREKWDREDYVERTVKAALECITEFYDPNENNKYEKAIVQEGESLQPKTTKEDFSPYFKKDTFIPKLLADDILSEPQDCIPIAEELFGYVLIPYVRFEKAFMFTGNGANGKSTFLTLLEHFVGSDNVAKIPLQELDEHKFKRADLFGKLVNLFADLDARDLQSSTYFKTIVSGDSIDAERKHQDPFFFRPFARLAFSANELPQSPDNSYAYFRRWCIIPFPKRFEGKDSDKSLADKMTEPSELSGLLNRALKGLHRLFSNEEFTESATVKASLDDYKKQNDTIAAFINDCCAFDANAETERGELFTAYQKYCKSEGYEEVSRIACYNRIRAYTQVGERKEAKARYFTGIVIGIQ